MDRQEDDVEAGADDARGDTDDRTDGRKVAADKQLSLNQRPSDWQGLAVFIVCEDPKMHGVYLAHLRKSRRNSGNLER